MTAPRTDDRPADRDGRGPAADRSRGGRGFEIVLVAVYGIFALSATARSLVQVLRDFDRAPVAYSLSLLAAATYIAVTVALVRGGRRSRVARVLVVIELIGVLAVGTLTVLDPVLFPEATVWSVYGQGYGYVPLALPVLALVYMLRGARKRPEA
ncbi:hypothetical protein [Brachybacterium sp. GU-2]|uniref:hypothetical protein n=1 Tax=Brachybacterium sp. GU-2 TaxID=3069708 RepID=UPI00280AE5A0|nr:hypothetical protein [Brachybacterium sp. GU-2]WME24385.1 hypothetical protein RBL05_06695 [Brachybacterium sp. GU-2]